MPPSADEPIRTEVLVRDGDRLKLRTRKVRIEVIGGPNAGQTVDLAGVEIRIGSGRGSSLLLLDPTVSRHHLTLRVESGGLRVIDAGSSNGTTVDGVRVRDAWAKPDSAIGIGNSKLRLRLTSDYVELPLSSRERFGALLGHSVLMREVFSVLERIALTDDSVLVEGETGTGKELAAEAIHEESPRGTAPFVVFDCSAVSPNLIESELFGHVRGAFTGAVADRVGAFEAAHGGTLFLDEIGELPLELQPKLLRALERFEVRPVGATSPRRVDVRIVAATNRNLAEEVAAGTFREDLYYRLAVVRIRLPPLRERPEDVRLLVAEFVRELERRGRAARALPESALAAFEAQAWPGNVRELRNAVARALSLGPPSVRPGPRTPAAKPSLTIDLSIPLKEARDQLVEAFEEAYLRAALQETGGNASRAAEVARVNRKLVQRAIKRYGLRDRPEGDDEE